MKILKLIFLLAPTIFFGGLAKADSLADAAKAYSKGEYKIYLIFLVLICTLLLACNSTSKLSAEQQKQYRSEVAWQCPELKEGFHSRNFSSRADVMSIIEKTSRAEVMSRIEKMYSNYTCEKFKDHQKRVKRILEEELVAKERAERYQFESGDENVVHCHRSMYGFLYCDDPVFGRKTYPPTYLREN